MSLKQNDTFYEHQEESMKTREVKFRGRTSYGIWVFGSLFINEKEEAFIFSPDGEKYPVFPDTVGQFTGRRDKNGKEIYEGDICNIDWSDKPLEVVFTEGAFGFIVPETSENPEYYNPLIDDEIEVVGNKFENPELIK